MAPTVGCFSSLFFHLSYLFFSLYSVFLVLRSYNVIDVVVCSSVFAIWSSFSFFSLSYSRFFLDCCFSGLFVSAIWSSISLVFPILGSY